MELRRFILSSSILLFKKLSILQSLKYCVLDNRMAQCVARRDLTIFYMDFNEVS